MMPPAPRPARVSLGNVVNGDAVSASGAFAFADPNAGAGKAVTISNIALSGAGAGNYVLASTSGSTTATIFKAPLAITAEDISAVSLAAAQPLLDYTGLIGSDTPAAISGLVVSFVPTADPTLYRIALSGGVARNYALSYVGGVLTLTVPPLSEQLAALDNVFAAPSAPGQGSWSAHGFVAPANSHGFDGLPIILVLPPADGEGHSAGTASGYLPLRFTIDWHQLSELAPGTPSFGLSTP